MLNAAAVGKKYGESINDFSKAVENTAEAVLMDWCNDGMEIMQRIIRQKSRTRGGATLAQDMYVKPLQVNLNGIRVAVASGSEYYDFVDKGVKGVKRNKAPRSPYKFKTIGAGKKMVASFKQYIAATGLKDLGGKKLIQKNKKKQADLITQAAKTLAVRTKIGGMKPMNYIGPAVSPKRIKDLERNLSAALGATIKSSILKL